MSSLDRVTDGQIQKCDECSRDYRGEAWMDYCAECHAELERTSPLRDRWACLTCSSTFEAARLIAGPTGLKCPNCGSLNLSTAHGAREIPEYYGDIGTKQ